MYMYAECEDAIDMKPNEVYGTTSRFVTTDDIKTIPNEAYGVVNDDHHAVSTYHKEKDMQRTTK